ncbi:MAG: peptidoglycan bridge formation glycyltransferase FemA/FemB family protein, partial [Candidatus Sungbacteria bacterium]|nr:peptidoglycan bridge formation glycyltransferase FemA/FemB family protein [Candidatus Sungbacteria bacterium]
MHSFLQSHEWEKFQESVGRRLWRVSGHLVIQHELPRGFNYLYVPHLKELSDEFLREVRKIAVREKSIFLKVDPFGEAAGWKLNIEGWQFSHFLQPRKTTILDLTKSEEALLSEMHQKTRYNIRIAGRHGVSVIKCPRQDIKKYYLDMFWELLQETSRRDMFNLHPRAYYQRLMALHGNDFSNTIFFAEYRGKPLAAALIN